MFFRGSFSKISETYRLGRDGADTRLGRIAAGLGRKGRILVWAKEGPDWAVLRFPILRFLRPRVSCAVFSVLSSLRYLVQPNPISAIYRMNWIGLYCGRQDRPKKDREG